MQTFNKILSRNFSKIVKFQAVSNLENTKITTKVENDESKISNPVASLLGLLSTCEAKTIVFNAQKHKIDIKTIKISIEGEFDFSHFYGMDKTLPNTFTEINDHITIESTENNKEKLSEIINNSIETCPIGATLRLAGVRMKHKINYIEV